MRHTNFPRLLEEVIANYPFEGELIHCTPFGSGHINDTYLLTYRISKQEKKRFILQKINTTAFKKPVELMENMINITAHLRKKIEEIMPANTIMSLTGAKEKGVTPTEWVYSYCEDLLYK